MALDLCSLNMPNAGAPGCDKARGIPRFLIVGNYEFTVGDLATIATFKAALKAQTLVGRNLTGKLIVLPLIMNVEKKTSAHKEGTLNQGFSEVLQEGFPAFIGGVQISNLHAQRLRPLNGQDVQCFVVDDKLNVWGTWTGNSTFRGESSKIFVGGDDFTDGQASKTVEINVSYTNVEEFKASSAYFTIDFAVSDYGKLKDVQVVLVSGGGASNVHNLTGKIKTGKANYWLDVYIDYSTLMANVARWTLINNQTGVAVTITSVAVNAGGYWVFTIDSTAYTALTIGYTLTVNFAAPSVLDAAGVTGVEGLSLILTKTA